MVGGSAIKDCYFSVGVCGCGKDVGWVRRDYLCEGGIDSWWTRREDTYNVVDGRGPEGDYTLGARREDCGLARDSRSRNMNMSGSAAIYEDGCACPFDGRERGLGSAASVGGWKDTRG